MKKINSKLKIQNSKKWNSLRMGLYILNLNSRRGGFTLLEVMIAILLISVILGALYSSFFLSHKAIEGLDDSMQELRECRAALDIIRREINSCFYRNNDRRTAFRLEDRDVYGRQSSRLVFTAFSPGRPGLSEIRYFIGSNDKKLILRKEIAAPFGQDKVQDADVIESVEEFTIEARNDNRWVKTWDSSVTGKLPDEIRVSLKIKMKEKDVLLRVISRPMIT